MYPNCYKNDILFGGNIYYTYFHILFSVYKIPFQYKIWQCIFTYVFRIKFHFSRKYFLCRKINVIIYSQINTFPIIFTKCFLSCTQAVILIFNLYKFDECIVLKLCLFAWCSFKVNIQNTRFI